MVKTLFFPGASGSALYWKRVSARSGLDGVFLSWPGLGNEPAQNGIGSIDDLVDLAAEQVTEPVNIAAQSMGGVIAIRLALRFPRLVSRLVLVATSGGVPVDSLGGCDWRPEYFKTFPQAGRWIGDPVKDLSHQITNIQAPTLLLWGELDPISPVLVGERLRTLLPCARLRVFPEGGHDLVLTHSTAIAAEIKEHIDQFP